MESILDIGIDDLDYSSLLAEAVMEESIEVITVEELQTTLPVMEATIPHVPRRTELVKHQGLVHVMSGLKGRMRVDINIQGKSF